MHLLLWQAPSMLTVCTGRRCWCLSSERVTSPLDCSSNPRFYGLHFLIALDVISLLLSAAAISVSRVWSPWGEVVWLGISFSTISWVGVSRPSTFCQDFFHLHPWCPSRTAPVDVIGPYWVLWSPLRCIIARSLALARSHWGLWVVLNSWGQAQCWSLSVILFPILFSTRNVSPIHCCYCNLEGRVDLTRQAQVLADPGMLALWFLLMT